ncbi:MAG: DUF4386 domain-containing protein [Anaerolineales bacterium]|nr:DUF4386 domain-containing protein [Anaerolineales bacterium]
MTTKEKMNTDKNTARLLGFMFVFVVVAATLSAPPVNSVAITILGPPDNISETMIKISDNPTTMQMSIVGYLIEAVAIVLLAVLLYTTLKNQNKIISRWAFGLWIVEAVFVAIKQISAFSLLNVSQEFVKAGATDSSYFQTLGRLFYETFQFGYGVQMVFYCTGGILFYYLFFKSKYVPIAISLWGIAAASLAFIGTLVILFGYDVPLYVFLPILPFELAIGVWLIVKGFNSSANASESGKTEINEV